MNIPAWLKAARKQAGLTQEEAGALVGVTKGNWSAWENERHSPSVVQIAKLAEALQYPLPANLGGQSSTEETQGVSVVGEKVTYETENGPSGSGQVVYAGVVTYSRRIPVSGSARLRPGGLLEIDSMGGVDGFVLLQTQDSAAFALRIRGDFMAPAIRDGWYVVISPDAKPAVGEYVALQLKDGTQMVRELLYERADTVAVMEVNGNVRLSGGEIAGPELPTTLEDLQLQAQIAGESVRLQGSWKSGKTGQGTLGGTVAWADALDVDVQLKGSRLP
ncbi:MAG: helix-turn-helix domain-containing protein, partial [Comamonadaceae bacterium]